MEFRVVDIFSGGGGLGLGFKNSGYKVVAAFDNWQPALDFYIANFNGHPIVNCDLSEPSAIDLIARYKPNMIIGGPPCQDFSSAGKRDETLGRADLTVDYALIVSKIKPTWFVMENVERAQSSNSVKKALKIFKDANYGITKIVLDASKCGVPQKRKRFFVIGELNGNDDALLNIMLNRQRENLMTMRDYFGNRLNIEYYYRHPRSYKRRGIFRIDEPSPTIRGVNRPVPEGYPGHPGDPVPMNENIRPLTTLERFEVQTFPSNIKLVGSKTDLEQIVGNAVPVKLAQYVAEGINQYLENKINGFRPNLF
ncbi:DNA (cytosine-5-)-methyltransferase [bacterium]|nr:DNA (cytosine-5-)-methyltransferase [bacterium]MBU1872707.1 DNA (cytosine-5-)-methyltransferase [bacterium]